MADLGLQIAVIAATVVAIVVPFLVIPDILERLGYNARSAFVRGIVWASFLVIVLIPAAVVGYLFSITNPVDWLLAIGFLLVAILWDYYRLNPDKIPWSRSRT